MPPLEVSEAQGVRTLHFGSGLVQGAMRIARPWSLELEYTREMMLPLVLRSGAGWPRSVLQVGLGAASFTRFLHRHFPATRVTVVETRADVVAAARQFFRLPDESPRLRIVLRDAAEFVAGGGRRFDVILLDGFDADGRAGMLESLPFYLACAARLGERGILAANLLGRPGPAKVAPRLHEAFEGRARVLPPCTSGNTTALAWNGPGIDFDPEALRGPTERLRAATGLDLRPTRERLRLAATGSSGVG